MNITLTILLWATYILSLYFTIFWFIVFIEQKGFFKKEKRKKIKLAKSPFVSILIPAYNEEEVIQSTIKSVLNLNYPKNRLEVIVINDGSTDKTQHKVQALIKEDRGKKIILLNQKNQGKAKSLNNALKIAKGEFFACLDADSYVEKDTLTKMLVLYEKENDPDLTIVTPAMKVKKPKNLIQKLQRVEYILTLFVSRLMSRLDCIYVAPGPFSLYRKKTIIDMGGFEVGNLTEDQEIAYRAQKHQYKIKQCYNAYVYTIAPKTAKELYKQRDRWFKGGLINALKYRKLLWNRDYGDFGMMQMTINLLMFFLSMSAITLFSYYIIIPLFKNLKNLYLVRFDIIPYIKDMSFNFNILNFDFGKLVILFLLFIITFILFYLSHKNAREKIRRHGTLYLIPYFLVYYIAMSMIVVVTIFELMIGKRQKW
ncbi:glycosyltransferase [Candidatus Woesearchaeota archaeon]|nr:glycosyltransferase [Candidatus Woesearchaeota archaeon]